MVPVFAVNRPPTDVQLKSSAKRKISDIDLDLDLPSPSMDIIIIQLGRGKDQDEWMDEWKGIACSRDSRTRGTFDRQEDEDGGG